ncbi:MAG TPA: response regulator [Kofleriaceae bacterium]|nr:response regulator [Kofleriaceae bacterium]
MSKSECKKTVLVVEDDPDVRDSLVEILQDNEYIPVAAANGQEALERLAEAGPDTCLILLDMMMPVMDGWEFRSRQRQDAHTASIPVVLLSAYTSLPEAASDLQVDGFLKKPVKLETLLQTVAQFCAA